jgi:hypothetical protein
VTRRLPALLLLLVLIFRIAFGWADMPGTCHHTQEPRAVADVHPCHVTEAPACHHQGEHPGCQQPDATTLDDSCSCGCCHLAVALCYPGLPDPLVLHEPAIESLPRLYLSYIPTPAHRPPIARLS